MSDRQGVVIVDNQGKPIGTASNPLITSGGGGGGGSLVDQGAAGTDPWLIQDGSGLLATAAKQDAQSTTLSSIYGQLDAKTSTLATEATAAASKTSLDAIAASDDVLRSSRASETTLLDIKTQQTDGSQKTQIIASALPTGAATEDKQDVGNASLASIDGKLANPLPVSGPLTDTQLRASPVPVSGPLTDTQLRASPVPITGTVTSTPSGTQNVNITQVGGNSVTTTIPVIATQGTAAAATAPWVAQLSDGTSFYKATTPADTQPTSSAAASQLDGHSQTLGTTSDAEAPSGSGTVIAILKRVRTLFGGGLPATLASGRLDVNVGATTTILSSDLTDRAARLVGIVYGSLGQLRQTVTDINLAVETFVGGTAIDPRQIRALTTSDQASVGGLAAAGAANSGNPVRMGGTDGGTTRNILTDASGRIVTLGTLSDNSTNPTTKFAVLGARANASAPTWGEGNVVPLSVDNSGNIRAVITPNGQIVASNSTTTLLGVGGVYNTAPFVGCLGAADVSVIVRTDQASATDGLQIIWSSNGVDTDDTDVYTVAANDGKPISVGVKAAFVKVNYTNGGVAQGVFRLQTIFHGVHVRSSTHRSGDAFGDQEDTELVTAALRARDSTGLWQPALAASTGGLLEGAAATPSNTTLMASATSQQAVAANAGRIWVAMTNNGGTDAYYNFGATAAVVTDHLLPVRTTVFISRREWTGAIQIISVATASGTIKVTEATQ